MNKKTLFLLAFLGLLLVIPFVSHAAQQLAGAAGKSLSDIIDGLKKGLLDLGVSLAIIGFMVSGILFISGTADPKLVTAGKAALVAATTGIVIMILASSADQFIAKLFGLS